MFMTFRKIKQTILNAFQSKKNNALLYRHINTAKLEIYRCLFNQKVLKWKKRGTPMNKA